MSLRQGSNRVAIADKERAPQPDRRQHLQVSGELAGRVNPRKCPSYAYRGPTPIADAAIKQALATAR